MGVERTIVLKGNSYGHHEEGILDTVATPGMHVTLQPDGKYDLSPETAAELVKQSIMIVKEDAYQGKRILDPYVIGDRVFLYKPIPGDHIHAFVKSGQNIAVGDQLVAEGGGTGLWIEAAGTEVGYKLEALESSGGALAANTHIKCRVIGVA